MGDGFSEVIHVPTRLRVCALLAGAGEVEFSVIRDALHLSDSVLSKHLKVLEQAGFVGLRKGAVNTRTRTWVHLSKDGQRAFKAHVDELRKLAANADQLP
ncbi:transcriptional regulator [Paenarthrobacter aurescens]|uniref:MarR family transcriptional regulator n=1 Tax=Paenarthrobacter aurescens TaxID=43663 RepID=A0A4Y3NII6_PAEAU|nr:transcriptional regulator [Paenarthrobacter aurescens]MDO6141807.1 transcriptional regulator [Paenarthrobacter aurescens]MDO6149570.1 transcriptional regulator [Paenarthrobacter aurescens]MDO6156856.1 transcriptional regulator [Paenarthrobacter aurescens]MDO6160842.1 transcriptional regulator [Paenarthrobacter aurescens]GEB18539.1 MarR family transcriptional regulator [Paenarthrobacter aurescens]